MNKKTILLFSTTLALASLGFYFYKKNKTKVVYEKSVEKITENYQVFN
jgi:hypothetical protein